MSAPADSTQSGGKAVSDETSRLDQPKDAVPMESMPQPPSEAAPAAHDADKTILPKDDTKPSSSTAVPSTSESPEQSAVTAAASLKGKEKENAPPPPAKESQDAVMAIGEAVDDIRSVMPGGSDGPVCNITLLLTSGSRHPYKIDSKYLSRRNVDIPDQTESGQPDPFSISIYTLKELILREWRSDWEAKPSSPSSIRLIHFGKLLDDKEPLKKYQLSAEAPNVVHMSIRPQDLDEEEPKSGSKNLASGGADGQRQRGGGCCVVL
ncbi:ubiquitin-related domain-containing protein [Ilyonectria robusta]|uniref:ubiquitin-related domain-containing protein n=1 Tax=Ilyonectria robusta TaxID=1079257 RepID=UPI001E8E8FC7|nr:ubiquitin-related domain-containing protein [Ilyonectria robusta]KAH8735925.1 ubiquitin-related domain-containing protein [Ilyonectria robusta]